ncbi:MAG: PAS domain S-box protein [Candidatus Omnitrophica bacterium]|nr:PAS domain S-box protein [Candidatus Omnitrophota bacterium]
MSTAIKENTEMLHKLLDNAGVIVFYLDRKGSILLCNKKAREITGLDDENIAGKNWLEILFRDKTSAIKKDMLKAVMDESMGLKREKDFEGVILDKDGNERLISWNLAPVQNEGDQAEGNILVGQDITEAREKTCPSKNIDKTFKEILSGIKEYALYLTNPEGFITYFGMGSEAMLGWSKQEIIFKHAGVLHYPGSSGGGLEHILKNVRKSGKYETEAELVTKSGQAIPVILTANRFLDSGGKASGYIFIAKDITERKKMEYQAFQAEKLAALGQLSAGIAHEINNPLLVISGRAELLKGEKDGQKLKKGLNLIDAQAQRIRRLVDGILKFSRKTTPVFEKLDVNEVIELVLPLICCNAVPTAEIEIKKEFEKNMPRIKGDSHQLQEVLLNLLINAYQSMPEGGTVTITTGNFQDLYAQVCITDTGAGIPAQHLKNIFMPFFSTKDSGTGLGLSISHNIIKSHNGSIEVESQVGKGSTFTIKLPFIQKEVPGVL